MKVLIEPSADKKTKYTAYFFNSRGKYLKKTSFGALGYGDYPHYHRFHSANVANKQKERYIARHKPREDWHTDPTNRGLLSAWVLWNKPTVKASIHDYTKEFKLKLIPSEDDLY